jgi:signal transduction histidine kinase
MIRTARAGIGAGALAAALLASGGAHAADEPPAAARQSGSDLLYVAKRGDTLISLSKVLLERPNDWPQVQKLNAIADPRRIPTGRVIRFPLRLLKGEPAPGRIEQAVVDARVAAAGGSAVPARAGETIAEGARVDTGADGYVTVRLADGSMLRIQAASRAVLERSGEYPHANLFAAAWRLLSGRVEALVTELTGGEPRFEVRTPQSVLGVRGTEFRVASDTQRVQTRGEVLAGSVDVAGRAGATTRLAAGFATIVDASGRAAAPDLSTQPALQERLLVRFDMPAVAGAAAYRAQVAHDRTFQAVAAESVTATGSLRFAGLADQDWFLRVRAIDARGIEGRDAVHAFRLKARPEPPIQSAPPPRGKLRATGVEFAWTRNPDATAYDFQLAADAGFATPLQERRALADTGLVLDRLAPGTYFWRVASVRSASDRGPWGDPATFTLGALPGAPASALDAKSVRFSWAGEPGQTFEFQLARDRAFSDIVVERALQEPEPRLKVAERQRDDLLGFVSHDIRSPQASLISLVELRRAGRLPFGEAALLDHVEDLARRSLELADEFVQVARAEGKPLVLEDLDPDRLLDDALREIGPQAQQKNVAVERAGAAAAGPPLRGERPLLLRALANLLNNAVKFSPAGATVRTELARRDGYCVFVVQDQGPGIAQEDIARLFQRYQRVESGSMLRLQPGIGLGLVFVDAVARRHGGRVTVESRVGAGARFELWIPVARG